MSDWGRGNYERTAGELQPAAERAIAALAPQAGERVLDVACGTGNAALLAAAHGAQIAGLDAAERLVEVARQRAAEQGAGGEWVVGDATALPFDADAFDAAISVFGVIFAPDAAAAASELTRVVRPGGRVVVTGWIPGGPVFEAGKLLRDAVAEVVADTGRPPVAWGDPEVVAGLFAGHEVTCTEETISFPGPSPEAVAAAFFDEHPVWLAGCDHLTPERVARLREETVAALRAANEDPSAFLGTSRYLLTRVTVR